MYRLGDMNIKRSIIILMFFAFAGFFLMQTGCTRQAESAREPVPGAALSKSKTAGFTAEPDKPAPEISFENVVLDFGQIGPGVKKTGELRFSNTGNSLLKITEVVRCCGVVAKVDKTEYAPGQSGTLKVEYNAPNFPATINKLLYVKSNDKAKPEVELTMKARVVLKVDWQPRILKLIPKEDNFGCPEITIKSVDGKPFSITQFASTGNCITADIDPSVQATKFILRPKADREKLKKMPHGKINITTAYPEPNTAPDTISMTFQTVQRFTFTPQFLIMMYSGPQKPKTRLLTMKENYGGDFEVVSTSSKSGHVKVISQEKIDGGSQFRLEITPAPVGENSRFVDTFTITLKDGTKLEVPCRGVFSGKSDERQQEQGATKED